MKPELARQTPTSPMATSSSTKDVGVGSCLKSTGTSGKAPFLWENCANLIERDRVDIKQQAVLDGLRLGERLSSILRNSINGENQALGAEELADWVEKLGRFILDYYALLPLNNMVPRSRERAVRNSTLNSWLNRSSRIGQDYSPQCFAWGARFASRQQ